MWAAYRSKGPWRGRFGAQGIQYEQQVSLSYAHWTRFAHTHSRGSHRGDQLKSTPIIPEALNQLSRGVSKSGIESP